MQQTQTRYNIEHCALPEWFFEAGEDFIDRVSKEFIYACFEAGYRQDEVEFPYTIDQFDVHYIKLDDTTYMAKIHLPEPETSPLCSGILLVFDEGYTNLQYFTVELADNVRNKNRYMLCEWDEDENHYNYDFCNSAFRLEEKILAIHKDRFK